MSSLSLLQWIFPTQESNCSLLDFRQIFYQLSYQGSPYYDGKLKPKKKKKKKHPPNTVTFLNKTAGNKLDLPALLCADMIGFVFGMIETIKRRL